MQLSSVRLCTSLLSPSSGRIECWEPEDHLSAVAEDVLQKHFTHAARLYEQGRLKSLETIEQYLSHWLRWSKGIGIALPNALDTIKRSLNELCEETTDVMIPTLIQAMKAWMKTQELQHEKDIINRSKPSPKESVSYFTCSLSNPISNGGRNSPHC